MGNAHNILGLCDSALVAYLLTQVGTEDDTYPAKRAGDKSFPDTICWSSKARLLEPHSGVYVVSAMVQVRTDPNVDVDQTADEKKAVSEDRVATTFDAFWTGVDSSSESLAEKITQAAGIPGFTIQACTVVSIEAGYDRRDNGAWTDSIDLEIVCCPEDVS